MASTKQAAQKRLKALVTAELVDAEALTHAIEEARLAGVSAMLLRAAASRLSEARDGLEDQPGSKVPPLESMTRMHLACCSGSTQAVPALRKLLAIMRASGSTDAELAAAANAKATDGEYVGGYAPLHYACQNGLPDAVTLLLNVGADPNQTKNNGATPLLVAVATAGHRPELIEQHTECVRRLVDHPRFDLELNDRGDEAKCSPAWVCVNREYARQDVLLPLLKLLLARGFDPNGRIHDQPALHMALRSGHGECALALVRAGADVSAKAPTGPSTMERWTALELCREWHGPQQAARLEEAAAASSAVLGARKRRDRLRKAAAAGLGPKEVVQRVLDAASALMATGRWLEAAGAYEEALQYPEDALEDNTELVQVNVIACLCQSGKAHRAIELGRELVLRSPHAPQLQLSLGTALADPKRGSRLSKEDKAEIHRCATRAEASVRTEAGAASLAQTGLSLADFLERVTCLREFARDKESEHPAYRPAGDAMDEFNRVGGCTIKAAASVNEALRLDHPNPWPIRMVRGSIYYQWAKETLEGQHGPTGQAESLFETALVEFQACAEGIDPSRKRVCTWNAALVLISTGRVHDGCAIALSSLSEMLDATLGKASSWKPEETQCTTADPMMMYQTPEEYLFHLQAALQCMRLLLAQQARRESGGELDQSSKQASRREAQTAGSSQAPASAEIDLVDVLERVTSLGLVSEVEVDQITDGLAAGALCEEVAAEAWADAARRASAAEASFAQCRSDAAAQIIQRVLGAQQEGLPSRVLSSLLKQARLWDAGIVVPPELEREERRINSCGTCGRIGADQKCPCGAAWYCDQECQKAGWKAHKRTCSANPRNRST
jgi:ankyrin repeat protein